MTGISDYLVVEDILLEQVYGIIDSKIQYMEFQTNKMVQTIGISLDFKKLEEEQQHYQYEQLLFQMETYSKMIRLLLILRVNLKKTNALFILDLLSNNKFLSYSVKDILYLIKKEMPNEEIEDIENI